MRRMNTERDRDSGSCWSDLPESCSSQPELGGEERNLASAVRFYKLGLPVICAGSAPPAANDPLLLDGSCILHSITVALAAPCRGKQDG